MIKTEIGSRREFVRYKKNSPFYRPDLERYLGQFPINYVPKTYPLISKPEIELLKKPTAGYQTEFDLVLEESFFQSTDKDIYSDNSLDHINQVKVSVLNYSGLEDTEYYYNLIKKGIYSEEFSKKYNLECYFVNANNNIIIQCYGFSNLKNTPSIFVQNINERTAFVKSYNPKYDIYISWRISNIHLNKWKEVNNNIWRLISSWNVSPLSN